MPERVNTLYGKIDENHSGIIEFKFDTDHWTYKKSGNIIRIRRKGV